MTGFDLAVLAAIAFHQPIGRERLKEIFGQEISRDLIGRLAERDLIGTGGDYFAGIGPYVETEVSAPLTATDLVDTRARLLGADSLLDSAIDPYIFVRTAYLQQRLAKVYDGNPPRELIYGEDYGDE